MEANALPTLALRDDEREAALNDASEAEARRRHGGDATPHDSLEIYARINDGEWAEWTAKARGAHVESSVASRLTYMDFSETEEARMNDIALAMLSLDEATARAATREL